VVGTSVVPWGIEFQVPLPFPGPAFVIGDLHGETMAAVFGIVTYQCPVTVPKRNNFGAGTWVWRSVSLLDQVSPRSAVGPDETA
jgi:hypothetical protein